MSTPLRPDTVAAVHVQGGAGKRGACSKSATRAFKHFYNFQLPLPSLPPSYPLGLDGGNELAVSVAAGGLHVLAGGEQGQHFCSCYTASALNDFAK